MTANVELTHPENLELLRVTVLDWHDGPASGFLEIAPPLTAWRFELFAERMEYDSASSRLFLLSEVPGDLLDRLNRSLNNSADKRVVVPDWNFETDEDRVAMEGIVADLTEAAARQRPEFLIRSASFAGIDEIWRIR